MVMTMRDAQGKGARGWGRRQSDRCGYEDRFRRRKRGGFDGTRRVKEKILGLVGPMGGRDMAFYHPLKDPAAWCLNGRWRQWRGYHAVAGGCG